MASGSSGGSVLRSGWAGARHPNEHKRPETYPPDNEAMPVERRWLGRVRDLERIVKGPEPLFGRGGGWKLDQAEFVCLSAPGAIPWWGLDLVE